MSDSHAVHVTGSSRIHDRRKILFVLMLAMAMAMMAVSSVNVALPAIQAGVDASNSGLQWVLTGYALIYGISLVPAGRAGDAVGRGALFVVGVAIFMLASLACGLASSTVSLNIARLAQGLGAGVVSPQITGMIQQYFAGAARAWAFGFFGLVVSASVAVGPLLAGGIIAALGPEAGWRWAFLINTPLGLLAIVLALAWLPFDRERELLRERRTTRARIDLDPVGTALLAGAVLSVMLPFMMRGSALIWLLLLLAPILLFAWIRWERAYQARGGQPVVDLKLFAFRSFSNQTRITATVFSAQPAAYVLLALYIQNGMGGTALETGLIGLPAAAMSALSSIWLSKYVLSYGRPMIRASLAMMALATVASITVVQLDEQFGIGYGWLAVTMIFSGFGMGVMISASQTLAMQDVPVHLGGTAGGVKQTTERVGTAMGVAVVTGIAFAAQAAWGWVRAYEVGLAVVAATFVIAFILATLDHRQHQRAAHAS